LEELADLRKKAVPNIEKYWRCDCIRSLRPQALMVLEVVDGNWITNVQQNPDTEQKYPEILSVV
jgi:hypothetical protein